MRLLFLFSITFAVFSCSSLQPQYNITKGCVHSVCIGANKLELLETYEGRIFDDVVIREGDKYPSLKLVFSNSAFIILELENDIVWAIRINDTFFTTSKGISVGNNFSDVKKAYPNATLNFGENDGGYISLFVTSLNGFFSFDVEDIFTSSSGIPANVDTAEKRFSTLKVNVILLNDLY